ncbi:predicted protein [Arabidopsis lyrata subsp. lyrata]|uniref:Predicted protein n=1 Tax=Arabidopsis lyrata subsp. lyrata TaxID=81972 RepID=D7M348_ARALL|nr:predicted protein [Arabidopsis lyrata subsp. lyrata]
MAGWELQVNPLSLQRTTQETTSSLLSNRVCPSHKLQSQLLSLAWGTPQYMKFGAN